MEWMLKRVTNLSNYDMPLFEMTFIHRAGQTAGAGQCGRCFTLLSNYEVRRLWKLRKRIESNSCPIYPIPATSFDSVPATYKPDLEKLKEMVESEAPRKGRQFLMRNSRAKRKKTT